MSRWSETPWRPCGQLFITLAVERDAETQALFRKLRAFVVVLWPVYPAIWVLAPSGVGLMDSETTALVVTYIDVVAKVGFGLIAINEYVKMAAIEGEVADPAVQVSEMADPGDTPATGAADD